MLVNQVVFLTQAFNKKNIVHFYRFFFYKIILSRFFLFSVVLLILKYDKQIEFPFTYYKPVHIRKFTVLRSPHIHKKAMEQFETRVYSNVLKFILPFNTRQGFIPSNFKHLSLLFFRFRDFYMRISSFNNYLLFFE